MWHLAEQVHATRQLRAGPDQVLDLAEQWGSAEDAPQLQVGKLQCGPRNAVDDGQRVLAAIEVSHPQHAWIAVQAGTGAGPFAIARREPAAGLGDRSEEPTSELQSLTRISYAVF